MKEPDIRRLLRRIKELSIYNLHLKYRIKILEETLSEAKILSSDRKDEVYLLKEKISHMKEEYTQIANSQESNRRYQESSKQLVNGWEVILFGDTAARLFVLYA
jgi:hypothetical protein